MSFLNWFVRRPQAVNALNIDPDYLKRRIDELHMRLLELETHRSEFAALYADCLDRYESILRRMTARLQRAQEREYPMGVEESERDIRRALPEEALESPLDLKRRLRKG